MNRKRLWTGIITFIGILIWILDSKTALSGAKEGLDLCVRVVIPSLFPLFLLSNLLTNSFMGVNFRILRPIGSFFGLPKGSDTLLIPCFLGGYPAGAQAIGEAYKAGLLTKNDAEKLLAFCNNAGPAFLFGMIGPMFPAVRYSWILWGIHILSAWVVSRFYAVSGSIHKISGNRNGGITEAMQSTIKATAMVCGWVTVFRVVICFLNRWILWILPATVQVALAGILELSNGCCSLLSVEDIPLRFTLCTCMLSFGGLCVTMQTASAANDLSIRHYITGKVLQSIFSLYLCLCLWNPWLIIPGILTYFLLAAGKYRNYSRNPGAIGV